MENATLLELLGVAKEIFGDVVFLEGSILMFGTVSYLGRCSTSIYARDWTEVVAQSSSTWHGIRICPLIPLISVECPGSVVREISELATWFEQVYDSNPQGMREAWHDTVTAMEMHSTGVTQLEVMESYKVVLPSSLTIRSLDKPVTFCSNNSRPVTFMGLPKGRCGELLGSLLRCIYDNFRACSRPESYLVRADSNAKKSENSEVLVALGGASNLKHSLPHFAATNMHFVDLTQPDWQATMENVENLASIVEQKRESTTAFVFDIFGNGSVRFEQFDGTYSLPFKSHGTYHLGGKVVTTHQQLSKNWLKTCCLY
jgi:hypothetical protein